MNLTQHILISRPKHDALALKKLLTERYEASKIILAPIIEIHNLPVKVINQAFDIIILTSRHAASIAAKSYPNALAVCVGDVTASAARQAGLNAISVNGTAEDIVEILKNHKTHNCLHLHGEHTRGNIVQKLNEAQISAESLVVYSQKEVTFSQDVLLQVHAAPNLIIPLYSPRTAALVSKNIGQYQGEVTLVSISEDTSSAWAGPEPYDIIVANQPNAASMITAIASQMHRTT